MPCTPGDLLLVSGTSIEDRAIRLAQRRRYPHSAAAAVTHVALIVSPGGNTIEAKGRQGIVRGHVSDYATMRTRIAHTHLDSEGQRHAIAYAESVVGEHYGWLSILTVGLGLLAAGDLNLTDSRTMMCSEFCAHALEHAGLLLLRDPAQTCPADLAAQFPR